MLKPHQDPGVVSRSPPLSAGEPCSRTGIQPGSPSGGRWQAEVISDRPGRVSGWERPAFVDIALNQEGAGAVIN